MKRSRRVAPWCAALLMATPHLVAAADGWKLHPDGFGQKSLAAWKAQQGEPDAQGGANQALYFQKLVPTAVPAAGVAVFNVPDGTTVADITPLAFDWRVDGHCGAGAPRFNLQYRNPPDTAVLTAFVGGCANMVQTPTADPRWIRASTALPTGAVFPLDPAHPPTAESVVVGLALVFDEGTDAPPNPGFVYLDNIQVGTNFWTSASDNGGP
jgi:hypothetical protein